MSHNALHMFVFLNLDIGNSQLLQTLRSLKIWANRFEEAALVWHLVSPKQTPVLLLGTANLLILQDAELG